MDLQEQEMRERLDSMTDTAEKRARRKKISAKCGQVSRRLLRNEPLKGKTLEFALSLVEPIDGKTDSEFGKFLNTIANKLKSGQPLSDYEVHIMVDVILLNARLS